MEILSFGLLCFTSFLSLINPLATMPVFLTMTTDMDNSHRSVIARKSTLIATVAILFFAVAGKVLFQFFGISVNSLRIAGGIIMLFIGMDMLQARLTRSKVDPSDIKVYESDISITPLAIPMICGPGVITNAMVLWSSADAIEKKIVMLTAILAVMTISLIVFTFASKIVQFLGETGNKVMMRLMGLIVMVIAVEFFFAGLKPIVLDIVQAVHKLNL